MTQKEEEKRNTLTRWVAVVTVWAKKMRVCVLCVKERWRVPLIEILLVENAE